MSGHSKWSTIKHKKASADAKRGKLFSKLVKEITVAARIGGDNLSSNIRLRSAVNKAKEASMPSKNIENAIKKGAGNKDGVKYEEVVYEGYAPGGVAILVQCLTDNKNRTVSEVRFTFGKNGGNLGENGSVAWQFEKVGTVYIERSVISEEKIIEEALEAGSEDVISNQEGYVIKVKPDQFESLVEALKKKQISIVNSEIEMYPKNFVTVSKEIGEKILKLTQLLDDLDDVQSVSSNESF